MYDNLMFQVTLLKKYLKSIRSEMNEHFRYEIRTDDNKEYVLLKSIPRTRSPNPDELIALITETGFVFDYDTVYHQERSGEPFSTSCDFKIYGRTNKNFNNFINEVILNE